MIVLVEFMGHYPLGAEVEINAVKIMQVEWQMLHRPIVFPFGERIDGVNPLFCCVFAAKQDGNTVYFAAHESGYGQYHIFKFSQKVMEKIDKAKKVLRKIR